MVADFRAGASDCDIMPILGRYEVVSGLHAGHPASIYRAKLVEGRAANFAIKLQQLDNLEGDALQQAIADFLERARIQKQAGAQPEKPWATIHHFAKTPGGAFYVSDLFPATGQTLLDSKVTPNARELSRLVSEIVSGLQTLRLIARRAHGNLKPTNILLSSINLDRANIKLTDPATNIVSSQVGEAGDFQAIGRIIFELIEHRAPKGDIDLTVPSTPQWRQLGPSAEGWRQLCADLLAPQREKDEGHLDELAALVVKLRGTAKRKLPGWLPKAAVLALAGAGIVAGLDYHAQRELAHRRTEWVDRLAAAVAAPTTAGVYQNDPSLRAVMIDVNQADDPSVPASDQLAKIRPMDYWRVRASLAAARRIEADVSAKSWPVAGRVLDAQLVLEQTGWAQPAQFASDALAALKPAPDKDLDAAIRQIIALDNAVHDQLPTLLSNWRDLDGTATALTNTKDVYLSAFATLLRRSAAEAIQLGPNGFSGGNAMESIAAIATKLLAIAKGGYPQNIDAQRWVQEVTSRMDLSQLTIADVQRWLDREPSFGNQDTQTAGTTRELQSALKKALDQVAKLGPDPTDVAEIAAQRKNIESDLTAFSQRHFTSQDMSDGTFAAERTRIESRIDGLLGHVHHGDPTPWIASLPTLSTHSDVINAYWEDWKHVLKTSTGEMTRRNDLFQTYRRRTEGLQKALTQLDADFPVAPVKLTGAFADAAKTRREREVGKLLAAIDTATTQPTVPDEKHAANDYRQWCNNLVALSHDFPIRAELLTLGDKPDETWKQTQPAFWNDPAVQRLVASDLTRLAKLRAIGKLTRADLLDAATESTVPDITFAAWQQLGGPSVSPPWPSQPGELESERDLRDKLAGMMRTMRSPQNKAALGAALTEQGVARWRRFVQAARSETMLQQAMELKGSFGDDAALFFALSPAARFNLALYIGRQQVRGSNEKSAASVIAALNKSALDLTDHKPVQRLLDRLARINVKESFSDKNPGDRFTLAVAGAGQPFIFQRVEPADDRPYYLCTTAVSFGQFAGVIQAAGAWDQAAAFSWGVMPGQPDNRRGPRVWEWVQKPSLTMVNPLLWFHPDDDNDYAPPFRIDRFNRTALSDDVGGNPSPDHPMQQIPAEAALYFAGLCGCRLPTASEWRNAYAIFERTVPPERWNLRDQTWDQQRRYAATTAATTIHWPDEGIFRPEDVSIPAGPQAQARPENDGTLFFRTVNGPGGGTFHQLIGNVAQFICEAPDAFDDWQDKSSAAAVRKFLDQAPDSLFVIGGSALSPPDMPLQTPLPLQHTDIGYADVGFRLAFTAPARSLSERLGWVLSGQSYLWEKVVPTTAPTGTQTAR
jgi:formylglycine-generating enzyme required for sulfatase activity